MTFYARFENSTKYKVYFDIPVTIVVYIINDSMSEN